MRSWQDQGYRDFTVSVNLSAVQFRHPRLPELVMNILEEAGVEPGCLQLELTEGVAMENPLAAIAVIDELHKRGIRISIDDFGTGYSSLTYLKRFNVYSLKIDRSFVRDPSCRLGRHGDCHRCHFAGKQSGHENRCGRG